MADLRLIVAGLGALLLAGACTTILGDDFEVVDGGTGGDGTGASASTGGGGATGGTSSSGGSGTTGGMGGMGGINTGDEICRNGIDDDDDGDIDCADSDCSPVVKCVTAPPAGWSGPAALYHAPAPVPECPAPFGTSALGGVSDLQYGDVSCGACSCTAPQMSCSLATMASWDGMNCPVMPFPWGTTQSFNCFSLAASGQNSFKIPAPTITQTGGCNPMGGAISNAPAPSWDNAARVCELSEPVTSAGCAPDEGCVPNIPGAGFEQDVCIYRAGNLACPTPYDVKHLINDEPLMVNDNRTCSTCSCSFSGSCTGQTTVYASTSCSSAITTVQNNGVCVNTATGANSGATVSSANGSCTPSTSAPGGDMVYTGTNTTVCCLP